MHLCPVSYVSEAWLCFAIGPPLFRVSQVFPPEEIEQVSNKDDMKTSLRKVVKEVGVGMERERPLGESRYFSLPSWAGH